VIFLGGIWAYNLIFDWRGGEGTGALDNAALFVRRRREERSEREGFSYTRVYSAEPRMSMNEVDSRGNRDRMAFSIHKNQPPFHKLNRNETDAFSGDQADPYHIIICHMGKDRKLTR
jgi:hypothetical protein